jgi:hypothetical protein
VTEDDIRALADDLDRFPEAERAALRFARDLTRAGDTVTDEEVARLVELHGPKQVVAMVLLLAHASFEDRPLLALDVPPEDHGRLRPLDVRFVERPLGAVVARAPSAEDPGHPVAEARGWPTHTRPSVIITAMGGFFFNLGRSVGSGLRKGKWFWQSLAGNEEDALRAEHEAGRDLAWGLLRQFEADTDPATTRLLDDLKVRLSACVRDRRRRFCVCPVKAAEVNAFALPGGYLFVTRPLLELCGRDPDELAFVLGHEMGHVLYGHAMERIMQGWMLDAAGRMVPVRGMAGAWLLQQANELIHKGYSREQELEADALGARLARAAGYDARAALRLLGRLPPGAPASALEAYFATHPPVAERLAQLNRLLKS